MSAWPYGRWTPTRIYWPSSRFLYAPTPAIPWSWPVLDAHEQGVAGDGMTDDAEPFTRLLEAAVVASPGSFVRIRRGVYRFDSDVEVFVPSFVLAPVGDQAEAEATSTDASSSRGAP